MVGVWVWESGSVSVSLGTWPVLIRHLHAPDAAVAADKNTVALGIKGLLNLELWL